MTCTRLRSGLGPQRSPLGSCGQKRPKGLKKKKKRWEWAGGLGTPEEGAAGPGFLDFVPSSRPTRGWQPHHTPLRSLQTTQGASLSERIGVRLAKAGGCGEGRCLQEPGQPGGRGLSDHPAPPPPPHPRIKADGHSAQWAASARHTPRAINVLPRQETSQSGQYTNLFIAHFLKVVPLGSPWG